MLASLVFLAASLGTFVELGPQQSGEWVRRDAIAVSADSWVIAMEHRIYDPVSGMTENVFTLSYVTPAGVMARNRFIQGPYSISLDCLGAALQVTAEGHYVCYGPAQYPTRGGARRGYRQCNDCVCMIDWTNGWCGLVYQCQKHSHDYDH